MKVLFIGGTGIISSAISRLAVERGIDLVLFNRGRNLQSVPANITVLTGDYRDPQDRQKLLGDQQFDVVVDWIAFTPEQVRADIEIFSGRTAQYIFISSASAYQKPATQYMITESTPLANPFWQYSQAKIASELELMDAYRQHGFPVTVVRPSHTYGDWSIPVALNSSARPWSVVDRMRRGARVIVHGDGSSLWTVTHNSDFAKAFIGLMGNPQSLGHAFHITSDEVLTWDQIHEILGHAAGVRPHIIHIPSDFIGACEPALAGGLLGDKATSVVFDNTKIKHLVPGYHASVSFSEGIRQTLRWFEEEDHPERRLTDEAWNTSMDRIISLYERAKPIAE
jgi:nucleoside-diphosphate-sugar epimerase